MTAQELIRKTSFEAIKESLKFLHPNDPSIQCLAGYKEAYDVLCNIVSSGEQGTITFQIWPSERTSDGREAMTANNVEGDYWASIAGREIVPPEKTSYTEADMAAAVLWGATFYGFTDHDRWSPFDEIFTEFGERARVLESRIYRPYIRDRRSISELKEILRLSHGVAFTQEVWEHIRYRLRHQNRSKRKRYFRLRNRINHLKKLDKRLNLLNGLDEATRDRELCDRIIKAGTIFEAWRESHVYGQSPRIDYLTELLTDYPPYFDENCASGDEILVIAYTSPDGPLTVSEETILKQLIDSRLKNRDIKWRMFKLADEHLGSELSLRFISICKSKVE